MVKYQNQYDVEDETKPEPAESATEQLDAEELTYKKRYGDIRNHLRSIQNTKDMEIQQLKSQLANATRSQIKFPKTDEEIKNWSSKYPEVAKIIDTIAQKRANEALAVGEKKLQSLQQMEKKIEKDKAEGELKRLHPDFDRIRADSRFHDWVALQPQWVQDSLYKNTNDARAAARAIDLYKADLKTVSKKSQNAAQSIGRTSGVSPSGATGMAYSESQVEKMSDREYEEHEEKISIAMKEGKFLYDLSGAAR
jgi:hypothetical protein